MITRNKRGLSEIVTSILIILIAVAAVVVIWQVLLPLIRSPGEQSVSLADCVANPITLSEQTCSGGVVTLKATKLGPKALTATTINFANQDGSNPTTRDLGALAGTAFASSPTTTTYTGTVVISGTYTLTGASAACNIPEVKTVTC